MDTTILASANRLPQAALEAEVKRRRAGFGFSKHVPKLTL